jgi:predicted dehydrogenase
MPRKRVIVVGCGSIGRRHARLLAKRADVELELCDVNPEYVRRSLSETGPRPTHDSLEQALSSRPDIVVIATPHALHAEQTVRALRAGVHVLCEKPMSNTLAGARRMLAAAQASDRILNIGFNQHFHPIMRQVRDAIRSGELGNVVHVHWHIGTYITLLNSGSRYQASMEAALFLDYVHQPDLLYWWLRRRPTAIYAAGIRGTDLELQSTPNVADVTLEYGGNLLATIHLNYVQQPERQSCEIIGDKKWMLVDAKKNILRIGTHESQAEAESAFAFERDCMYEAEHQAFLDAVDGKRAPESPADDAIVSQEMVAAAIQSWRRQRRVRL